MEENAYPDSNLETSNINAKWLDNIYENIKNLEQLERLGREGCTSLFDYMQIPPQQRQYILGDTQYKNLRFIVTELRLLLADLTPVINQEALAKFRGALDKVEGFIDNRKLFVREPRNQDKTIKASIPTEFFWKTLFFLCEMKIEIIREIAHILYVRSERKVGW